ncbi:uncharacterized protein LOC142771303 [Rhipicephalus microplus]|uniref:uncharacterized protein LOC142771303 n=1 Tax=Rhipicephalus microplus TaxID=6941 RepID=UPI003F6AD4B7
MAMEWFTANGSTVEWYPVKLNGLAIQIPWFRYDDAVPQVLVVDLNFQPAFTFLTALVITVFITWLGKWLQRYQPAPPPATLWRCPTCKQVVSGPGPLPPEGSKRQGKTKRRRRFIPHAAPLLAPFPLQPLLRSG